MRLDPSERRQLRQISVSPEVSAFLDTFPRGQMSPFVEKAIQATTEFKEYRENFKVWPGEV